MKKIISLLLISAVLLASFTALTSCGGKRYELVLVTDTGSVTDKGFNQSAWDGMTEFAVQRDLDCRYFIPQSKKYDDLLSQLRSAASDGAKVIVVCGECFEAAVYTAEHEYPDVKFILIDGVPRPEGTQSAVIPANTTSVMFASEQSGFLAGYAAVRDGWTALGFLGGKPDEDMNAYGCGFLQGAEYAAQELGTAVSVIYHYTNDNGKNDKNKEEAEKMYDAGVDLIFACGGDLERSAAEAAVGKRSLIICSDTDKRYENGAVLTSAVKGVSAAVKLVLRSIYDSRDFEYSFGGKSTYFDAANGGAGLASFVINDKNGDAFDRFYRFTKQDYDDVLQKLISKIFTVKRGINVSDPSGFMTAEELTSQLGLEFVAVSDLQE